ncbi:probable LRR receptor-like serine/threonine-protein kinase At3g47570 [Salvia splendens]|uniref:probable LRR receptor-like serine/threonine-protein kinase At3g47570 n=1 Tax=Salvia splendens TaxID=180675 RepID=UPI001C277076|nr:probable LRR receptor-like serine/threonine-protein kinase At3g47570 [Salvia splendens]
MYALDLIQRLKIAIDVAAALENLHHCHTFSVVHCDIKPSNVLLDQDMTAHLADFGISKLFDGGETVIQTQTMATIGHAAPGDLLSSEDQHYSAKEKWMLSVFDLAMQCLADSADERINMIEASTALHKIHATIVASTVTGTRRLPVHNHLV